MSWWTNWKDRERKRREAEQHRQSSYGTYYYPHTSYPVFFGDPAVPVVGDSSPHSDTFSGHGGDFGGGGDCGGGGGD